MFPNYVQALPQFLIYLVAGGLLLWLFASAYTYLTPNDEIADIRAGNTAATLMLVGALLGFLLPLCKTIAQHSTVMALVQWSVIALLVQLAVLVAMRAFWRGLHEAIAKNQISVGLFAGFVSVAAGMINAAAMP
jgi:putative membrane protein